jgi:hypothetical protein
MPETIDEREFFAAIDKILLYTVKKLSEANPKIKKEKNSDTTQYDYSDFLSTI